MIEQLPRAQHGVNLITAVRELCTLFAGGKVARVKTTRDDPGEVVDAEPGVQGCSQKGGSWPEVTLILGSGLGTG